MPLTGYVHATTPGQLILGPGVLEYESAPSTWTKFGAMRGGVRVTFGEEWRQPEIDGLVAPMAGIDRVVYVEATMEGTLLEWTAAKMAILRPGSASVVAAGVTTITSPAPGTYITEASLFSWRATFQKGDLSAYRVVFPKALPRVASAGAADRGEGDMPITLLARATAVNLAPYTETFGPI